LLAVLGARDDRPGDARLPGPGAEPPHLRRLGRARLLAQQRQFARLISRRPVGQPVLEAGFEQDHLGSVEDPAALDAGHRRGHLERRAAAPTGRQGHAGLAPPLDREGHRPIIGRHHVFTALGDLLLVDAEQVHEQPGLSRDAEVPVRQPDDHGVDVPVPLAVGDVRMPDVAGAGRGLRQATGQGEQPEKEYRPLKRLHDASLRHRSGEDPRGLRHL
jgi:hypothetical protein